MPASKSTENKGTESKPAAKPRPAKDEAPGSEQTQVVLPAEDEPVRRGGHILTEDGWVPEP